MAVEGSLARGAFETTDVDLVRTVLTNAYAGGLVVERSPDAPFRFSQQTASDSVMTVVRMRVAGHVAARMDGARQVLFTDITEGRYAWASRGQHGDERRPLLVPAAHELAVEFESVQSVMINLDPPTVSRWFARYGGLPPSPALLHRAVAGSDAVRLAMRFAGRVMPTDSFDSALVRAGLLDVLLSMTAHHLLPETSSAQRRTVPAALARAEEYFRDHAADPVSVADAAEAARLSVRGLQDQFQRWLQITPAQYLRNLRLERARADLVTARAEGRPERVADVARRWGFSHTGRFAASYAAAFGEPPSATLGR